jgi:hypothetical protein
MATLTPTITLTSTNAHSDTLNITVTNSLTVTNPVELAKTSIATGGGTELIAGSAAAQAAATYIYVKNTDAANYIDLKKADGTGYARLHAGEVGFFCIQPEIGLLAASNTAACILEWGKWSKSV